MFLQQHFCELLSLGVRPYCVRLLDLKKKKVQHFDPLSRHAYVEIKLYKSFCREILLNDSFYEAGVESGQKGCKTEMVLCQ